MLLVSAAGVPIAEALFGAGLKCHAVTRLEEDPTAGLPGLISEDFPSLSIAAWHDHLESDPDPSSMPVIDWMVICYPGSSKPINGKPDRDLQQWARRMSYLAEATARYCQLKAIIFLVPDHFPIDGSIFGTAEMQAEGWQRRSGPLRNANHGGHIETNHRAVVLLPKQSLPYFAVPDRSVEQPSPLYAVMDRGGPSYDGLIMSDLSAAMPKATPADDASKSRFSAKAHRTLTGRTETTAVRGHPAYSALSPGPDLSTTSSEDRTFFGGEFGVWIGDESKGTKAARPIRAHEIMRALGLGPTRSEALLRAPLPTVMKRLRTVPGKHGLEALFYELYRAEFKALAAVQPQSVHVMAGDVREMSMLPLPTEDDWRTETAKDHDLQLIATALQNGTEIPPLAFVDGRFRAAWDRHQFDYDDGLVYYYEHPKSVGARQLRLRVAPLSLRHVIMVACHSSPFSGHSGIMRTYARVAARFWWPSVKRDVDVLVRACLHCRLGKSVSREAHELLQELGSDGPFDILFMDFWDPGEVPDKSMADQKFLTIIDELTGHADGDFVGRGITTQQLLQTVFRYFSRYGLPKVVYVDADGKFAGLFKAVLTKLLIPVIAVSRENHKAVRNERFHRYLNHIQRINTANAGNLNNWAQGIHFAFYGWNSSPIDGTDIQRSVVSIGREFPFPVDTRPRADGSKSSTLEGQQALDYFDAMCPLLAYQRKMYEILVMERRKRHRDAHNDGICERTFAIGDIVVVRKQVQSNSKTGISAKLVFKTRGPYRVLGPANPGSSYWLQRLPFCEGLGVPGRRVKEKSSRMEKLPSTLVYSKMADGADTRFATMNGPLSNSPLAKWLKVMQYGSYRKAPGDVNWAYDRIADLWPGVEELDPDDDGEDEDHDDDDDGDDGPSNDHPQGAVQRDNSLAPGLAEPSQPVVDENDDASLQDAILQPFTDPSELSEPEKIRFPPKQLRKLERNSLKRLKRSIDESQDKLFFIQWTAPGSISPTYRLVDVVVFRGYAPSYVVRHPGLITRRHFVGIGAA
jgi:hypothetical protein